MILEVLGFVQPIGCCVDRFSRQTSPRTEHERGKMHRVSEDERSLLELVQLLRQASQVLKKIDSIADSLELILLEVSEWLVDLITSERRETQSRKESKILPQRETKWPRRKGKINRITMNMYAINVSALC